MTAPPRPHKEISWTDDLEHQLIKNICMQIPCSECPLSPEDNCAEFTKSHPEEALETISRLLQAMTADPKRRLRMCLR